jgi:cation diffusion facilitator CzcD-associated flavoprotein CzcO
MTEDAGGSERATEHLDVLVVGAGLSGIGAAARLRLQRPGTTLAILESRGAIGGTWDLFRYPGIRSDSDMFTLGYGFRPWRDPKAIADGPSIRQYVVDTAREYGVDSCVRYHHRVVSASWSTTRARWTVRVRREDTGEQVVLTCGFLYMCTGYYRYDEGYTPAFEGIDDYEGTIVHPQHWPGDLEVEGKEVVVIGSGATAVTLVPALAARAGEGGHVTMLQRTPSYVVSLPSRDPLDDRLRARLTERRAYSAIRWKHVLLTLASYQLSRRAPRLMKALLRRGLVRQLPPDLDLETHFAPPYDPWDQRLCIAPDGDLFATVRAGTSSIVTDRIERFTPKGLLLASGEELPADVVVTATGLALRILGGATFEVDGRPVDPATTVGYKGMMFSGLPNLAMALGYTNASWTLKCDLIAEYVCRLLDHMDRGGYRIVLPVEPPPSVRRLPMIDLTSGYVRRALATLPSQGSRAPWRVHQNYLLDRRLYRRSRIEDEGVVFSR